MIRVAFLFNYPTHYKGAINYFRNLFFAISEYLNQEVTIFLFIPDNLSQEYIDFFNPYVQTIKTNILTRNSPKWILDKICEKLFDVNPILDNLLVRYKIDVVSHSSFISKKVKTINWIMDFQHIHFSDLWTEKELKKTRRFLHRLITKSDRIFLSSFSAFDDFKKEYQELSDKVNILHFVCQPENSLILELPPEEKEALAFKYLINQPFFYVPNQFWSHKNHEVVFKAVKILRDKGHNILLITSGLMTDFRGKDGHIESLKKYVKQNNLENHILFLGLIPYKDVLNLITLSKCVINPSLFEGWSSTVEESKTMSKCLILSNIKVHKEQKPDLGIYFDPNDANELAEIMESIINGNLDHENININDLYQKLINRTEKFAEDYLAGIKDSLIK